MCSMPDYSRRTKKGKVKDQNISSHARRQCASWQSNSEEINNIILSTDKTTEFEIHDGVVLGIQIN